MPLTLNVGISKKLGLPDYGSIGATCNVTVELDGALLNQDLEGFHRHVRNAYVACAQAVNDELARHKPTDDGGNNGHTNRVSGNRSTDGNGRSAGSHAVANNGGNGAGSNGHQPSAKQLTYIRQLAGQIKGLGVRRLDDLAQRMFGKPVAGLNSLEASALIDALKGAKAGEIDLSTALDGATP